MRTLEEQTEATVAELVRKLEKMAKINDALTQRVERSMDQQANAFSLFQTAIGLEVQVRNRTEELKSALERLELVNDELVAARDAAERANRFKTRFFTAVGHDLLQPLHAARLSLSAMSEESRDPQQARLVVQIDHSLSSIEELLRTILDLSKLEAGVVRPALQRVRLAEIFDSTAIDLGPIARARGLGLTSRATDIEVRSDPLMLRRVVQNLLANAVNYTEHGEVLLAARRRGKDARIEVWDTGPGIEAAEQQRIFEEFQRGAASDRIGGAGFGLGLTIVKRMSEALGHRIELCSRPGKGTRFSIFVPYEGRSVPIAGRRDETPARSVYGFAGRKAVVVDNDAQVLSAMRQLLGRWSCECRCIQTMREALALLEAEPALVPDMILADYHLNGGETGIGVIARLREASGRDVPAIVITADRSVEVADEARRAGCELLLKPVRPAELRSLIRHLLR
jgi:signal transduction histidine kinase